MSLVVHGLSRGSLRFCVSFLVFVGIQITYFEDCLIFVLVKAYFGLQTVAEVPDLVGTLEDLNIPFSCIAVLKKHSKEEMTYKMFSRKPVDDVLLDQVFR